MKTMIKFISVAAITASLSACTLVTEFTSSTSSTLDTVTPDITLNEFVNKRYVAIRNDAANGGGENLDALAQLMGKSDSSQLSQYMKTNFATIFTNVQQPSDILERIETSSNTLHETQPNG